MGDTVVYLTVEQARELSALLKGLFGDDSTKLVHIRDHWYPRPWFWSTQTNSIPTNDLVYHGYTWKVDCSYSSTTDAVGPATVTFTTAK